jgi:molybdate transport system ATP-binding protein
LPQLLILDDPFSGLDYASRDALQKAIDTLLISGKPRLLLITPREEEIPAGITHVLRVDNGRVINQGPKKEILAPTPEPPEPTATPAGRPTNVVDLPHSVAEPEPAARQPILVDIKNGTITYNGVKVLDGINWRMGQGENWAVLGPNGAGKSTLLSLILADNPQAYANDITIFGRRRGSGESIWEIKREIGWVSPELQVYYHRATSCRHVICSGFFDSVGLYRTCSPDQAKITRRWLDELGLTHLADRPLGTVSVGEQRLVLLGRALVKEPALLILDEPCQGLDYSHRTRIVELLDRLCRQLPVSLIYVTHHFDEMPRAITHILKLNQGRIEQRGTREAVLGW